MDDNLALIAAVRSGRAGCPALAGFSVGNEGVPGSSANFHNISAALAGASQPLLLIGPVTKPSSRTRTLTPCHL